MKIELVTNTGDTVKKMLEISLRARKNVERALQTSAMKIYNGSRDKCPVDTGNLRGSITIKYLFKFPNYSAWIGTNVEYGQEVEYNESTNHSVREYLWNGEVHSQKNPNATWGFLRKSLAEEESNFMKNMSLAIKGLK